MDTAQFLERVKEGARLASAKEAQAAVEAVLSTLGERIYRTDRDHLAAMLPGELKMYLRHRDAYEKFTLEEFYTRVASRAGVGFPHAVKQARVVADVLLVATSEGQIDHLLESLPVEYRELFGRAEPGPESPTSRSS